MGTDRRAPASQRAFCTVIATYEIVALWTKWPTLTNLAHRFPVLGGAMVGVLAVHFQPDQPDD